MSLSKLNVSVTNHSNLPDKPTETADELKRIFDKASVDIKNYLNNTLTEEVDAKFEDVENELTPIEEKVETIEEGANKIVILYGTEPPTSETEADLYVQIFD